MPTAYKLRFAVDKTSKVVRDRISEVRLARPEVQPVHARSTPRQPVHRAAVIRQSQSRWHSTQRAINSAFRRTARQFSSSAGTVVRDHASYPKSRTSRAVSQLTSRAPFASTLRPNLTGGTLSRSAGGYSLGSSRIGGARYFSHTPAAPAQVVNNVSAAVRAFWLSGQKVQYDGLHPRSGERKYKAVTMLQDEAARKMRLSSPSAPGSYIDFKVTPNITAFGPLSGTSKVTKSQSADTLSSSDLREDLAVDFARAIKDLAIIKNDLDRLSTLGDLPITLTSKSNIRVRFPGCDVETVERLCDEVGVRRGVVRQDPDFDAYAGTEMALLFPFAPSRTVSEAMYSPAPKAIQNKREPIAWQNIIPHPEAPLFSPGSSEASDTEYAAELMAANPWLSSPSGYSSAELVEEDNFEDNGSLFETNQRHNQTSDYEGLEGIYRFLAECDAAGR
ncbi:MAG: hypothetical protein Q9160_000158 [Pyrenula sp. 1 TL-2023]